MPCPVDGEGRFTPEVTDFSGRSVSPHTLTVICAVLPSASHQGLWQGQLLTQIPRLRALCCAGRYVKEADKDIIKHLRTLGRLIDSSNYTHSYPFCWRSDTPLIQRVGLLSLVLSCSTCIRL